MIIFVFLTCQIFDLREPFLSSNDPYNPTYDINTKVAKISALSSAKIAKYEYLTGEEILSFNQKQIL